MAPRRRQRERRQRRHRHPAAPRRSIVSLAPHLTELLFAAGAGASVVGVGAFADYPEAAKKLPQVGDSAMLDLERIVALKPDLLVVWRDGNCRSSSAKLATLGIPVYASEPGTLADIANIAAPPRQLAGRRPRRRAPPPSSSVPARLRERYAGRSPLRLFYQVGSARCSPSTTATSSRAWRCAARRTYSGALAPLVPHGQRGSRGGRRPGRDRHPASTAAMRRTG